MLTCTPLLDKNGVNRNSGGGRALLDDPNYQTPDEFPGARSSSQHGSANNLTYLQPIDANVRFNGTKRPQGPGPVFEYPSVKFHNQPPSMVSKDVLPLIRSVLS